MSLSLITLELVLRNILQNGWPIHHILRSVTGDGLEYNLKTCIPDRLATPEMGDSLEHLGAWDCYTRLLPCLHCTPPHPSPESIISLNRPPGHVDDYVGALPYLHCGGEKGKPCTYFETLCLCHMSSARSTSDGRGPVTRKRVPDRETPPPPTHLLCHTVHDLHASPK